MFKRHIQVPSKDATRMQNARVLEAAKQAAKNASRKESRARDKLAAASQVAAAGGGAAFADPEAAMDVSELLPAHRGEI